MAVTANNALSLMPIMIANEAMTSAIPDRIVSHLSFARTNSAAEAPRCSATIFVYVLMFPTLETNV